MQAALKNDVVKLRRGKRYAIALAEIRKIAPRPENTVPSLKAIETIVAASKAKYDETVNVSVRLGVDPKQADQMVRGAATLPHGLGKKAVVAVFAKGEKAAEAQKAGADLVGADDLVEKILGGFQDFTSVVATPDMMGVVSKLGRVLGPRGLMPNPKVGTVTFDLAKTVTELKKGRAEFRTEKAGIVQSPIGKVSFGPAKLQENYQTLMDALMKAKPSGAKGTYILSIYVSSSMGPSVKVDSSEFVEN